VLDEGVGALSTEAQRLVLGATRIMVTVPMQVGPDRFSGLGVVPFVDGEKRVGSLVVLLRADTYAGSGPFRAQRVFDTGELYAVDGNGLMLSPSRFAPALRAAGLLGPDEESTARRFEVRDPLVDLTSGARPEQRRNTLPFTHPVSELMAGRSGRSRDGYRDYRGVRTLGAWAWDDVRRFGLVAEMDESEALEPVAVVRPLLLALVVALGLVVAAGAWLWLRLKAAEVRAEKLLVEANRLGQYELLRKLGEGGMGVVYEGRHALLQRPAAIKLMQKGTLDDEQIARFEREAKATAALGHPNTVSLYDFGKARDGSFYYVMELLKGADLEVLVEATGPLPPARVAHLLRQLCGSLAEAHTLGMVHRDLKPSNVFVTARPGVYDVVKVLDFGLVRMTRGGDSGMTQANQFMGSPRYMAPETFEGADQATPASDIYAVGAIAYWMLTGRPLFDRKLSLPALMMAHRNKQPLAPETVLGRPIDPALLAFIDACLRKDPGERPSHLSVAVRLLDNGTSTPWTEAEARSWWEEGPGRRLLQRAEPKPDAPDPAALAETVLHARPA
jgi:tRNA A-37 threonylcarbamoyl transferase component Bud32